MLRIICKTNGVKIISFLVFSLFQSGIQTLFECFVLCPLTDSYRLKISLHSILQSMLRVALNWKAYMIKIMPILCAYVPIIFLNKYLDIAILA